MPALRSSSGICSRNRFGVSDRRAMLSMLSPGGRAGRLCPPEPASLERIFHLPRDHGSPWGGKTPRPKDRHRPAGRRDPVHCPDRRPGGAVADLCWKRLRKLESSGVLTGRVALADPAKLGLTIFVGIEATNRGAAWRDDFPRSGAAFPRNHRSLLHDGANGLPATRSRVRHGGMRQCPSAPDRCRADQEPDLRVSRWNRCVAPRPVRSTPATAREAVSPGCGFFGNKITTGVMVLLGERKESHHVQDPDRPGLRGPSQRHLGPCFPAGGQGDPQPDHPPVDAAQAAGPSTRPAPGANP